MKTPIILHLAALSAAFVLPDEQVSHLQHVEIQRHPRPASLTSELLHNVEDLKEHIAEGVDGIYRTTSEKVEEFERDSRKSFDNAVASVEETSSALFDRIQESYFDAEGWLQSFLENNGVVEDIEVFEDPSHDKPPHHGPPGHHHGDHGDHPHHPPHDGPHDGRPPHHGPPFHHKSNLTIYELISKSNYTTKLAKLISKYDDLVEALNSTGANNFTVFAPTDRAFAKIPEHAPMPSEAQLKALLQYHVSGDFYPAGRILVSKTIPSLYVKDTLGDKPHPQRLSTNIGPRGLTVNFYSRIVAVDIFGTNGVIHGVDSIIIPPPKILKIIDLLPSEFSTLSLGLTKTGLFDELNGTTHHAGGTFFAPSNFAFQKLGPKINAFLFSSYGLKYLKAILQYHIVPGQTLYSDAFYGPSSTDLLAIEPPKMMGGCHKRHERREESKSHGWFSFFTRSESSHHGRFFKREDRPHHDGPGHHDGPPKGFFHVDLPTMLDDKSLSIDIARYGRLISIKINGFSRVAVSDGVAEDGVIHVVGDVLIPPKKLGGLTENGNEEMTVEELKERLAPYVGEEVEGELEDGESRDL